MNYTVGEFMVVSIIAFLIGIMSAAESTALTRHEQTDPDGNFGRFIRRLPLHAFVTWAIIHAVILGVLGVCYISFELVENLPEWSDKVLINF